jgi:O-succinylbenzoic acid--CoA ligase
MKMPRIIDPDGFAAEFIEEWLSEATTVSAHTSGSTGEPKAVELLKSDMRRSAEATCKHFSIGADSVLHLPLSTDYIAGKMMIVRAMVSGATLIVERPSNHPLTALPEGIERIDLTAVVPSQVEGLLASRHAPIVRNAIVGGSAMSADTERVLRNSSIRGWATYGMTETCSHVALRDVTSGAESYCALPGVAFSLDDRGCLAITGEGYSFGRLVTNDVVRLVSPHEFVWLGRYDNVINSGGIKLHPEAMEKCLAAVMAQPFYVTSRPSARWGEEAVVVVENVGREECDALFAAVRGVFDSAHAPKAVVSIPAFDYTSSGKIKRRKL